MNFLCLDLSLSNSSGCVFEDENPVFVFSIPTSSKQEHKDRLRAIGDYLLEIKNKFQIKLVVLEGGFSRFNISTQTLFKTIGVASYVLSDCEQIVYPPSTIKKIVAGSGKAQKEDVEKCLNLIWPDLHFENNDQSDACSVGLCYLIKNNKIKV